MSKTPRNKGKATMNSQDPTKTEDQVQNSASPDATTDTSASGEDQTSTEGQEGAGVDQGEPTQGSGDTAGTDDSVKTEDQPQTTVTAVEEPQAPNELLRELTETEKLVQQALSDGDSSMETVVRVCAEYRDQMAPNKITDSNIIRTQQLAFFRMIRDVLGSAGYYQQGLQLVLSYMREDYDGKGAMSVPFMMRGFDDATLANMTPENRDLFWSLVTLLSTAAGLNDPKQSFRQVSMKRFQATAALKPEMKQRLVSFFSE